MADDNDDIIDRLLKDFDGALRQGETPSPAQLDEYVARAPSGEEGRCCGLLVAKAIRVYAELGKKIWLDRYLGSTVWKHRETVCRILTEWLFENDSELAKSLGIHRFGHFIAVEMIGFGGFGTVFKCHHTKSGEPIAAVKVAHPQSSAAYKLLENELITLKKLSNSDGVSKLLDSGHCLLGSPFILMDFIDGQTLDDWRSRKRRLATQLLDICRQLTWIIHNLHGNKKRLCHGDISPSNILITGGDTTPTVHLVDFGNSNLGFQKNPLRILTAKYAAPELLVGDSVQASERSDLWSLGIILFEVLVGSHPFPNIPDDATVDDIAARFKSGLPSYAAPEGVTQTMWDGVTACMTTDPDRRRREISAAELLPKIDSAREYHETVRLLDGTNKMSSDGVTAQSTLRQDELRVRRVSVTGNSNANLIATPRSNGDKKILKMLLTLSTLFLIITCVYFRMFREASSTSPGTQILKGASQRAKVIFPTALYYGNAEARVRDGKVSPGQFGEIVEMPENDDFCLVRFGAPVNANRWILKNCIEMQKQP